MAFKISYSCDQGEFEEAYCMIDKISMLKIQKEEYVDDNEGNLKLKYRPELVYYATVRIYPDEGARNNLAYPLKTMSVKFTWDKSEDIFKSAYEGVKKNDFFVDLFTEDC